MKDVLVELCDHKQKFAQLAYAVLDKQHADVVSMADDHDNHRFETVDLVGECFNPMRWSQFREDMDESFQVHWNRACRHRLACFEAKKSATTPEKMMQEHLLCLMAKEWADYCPDSLSIPECVFGIGDKLHILATGFTQNDWTEMKKLLLLWRVKVCCSKTRKGI